MKTRLIIIGLISIIVIFGISIFLVYNQELKLATGVMTSDEEPQLQRILSDPICFIVDKTTGETGSAVTLDACFTLKQFEEIGCTKPMLEYLNKHSNILDFESDGAYYLDWAGLPDGMSQAKFDECWNVILEKRQFLNSSSESEQKTSVSYGFSGTQNATNPEHCSGYELCISGTMNEIIDGDTIQIDGGGNFLLSTSFALFICSRIE